MSSASKLVKREYEEEVYKKRNFKNIRSFFNMSIKGNYTIDDQTWHDLDLDRLYEKLDRNYSSPGESLLYSMLRNPLMEETELKERDKLIEKFKEDEELRIKLLTIFFDLNRDKKNSFLEMIEQQQIENRLKYFLYTFLGKVVPVLLILMAIFIDPQYMVYIIGISFINIFINFNERTNIKSNGLAYLTKIIKATKQIDKIKHEALKKNTNKIKEILKEIREIDRATRRIKFVTMWGGLFESLSVIFLIEESAYYSIAKALRIKKHRILDMYVLIGEIEALLSISGYQYNLTETYVEPIFRKELMLNIEEGVHPLIQKAIPNSITITNKGIVLTGTNMSGKSTFLRMLGINMLLAQTFYFAVAEQYEACFFNIVSSISPSDDLTKGKSFYMAEAEGILRIIKALEKEVPVFCPIDEIFRGTNPVERIAMSAEILLYLNSKNTISMVATHDRELVNILEDIYEFYYFSENVSGENGLSFDYKLKKGITQSRNAIKLLQYIGYPEEIIKSSYERAEEIKGFI